MAAGRFGGFADNTEVDFSDSFLAFGLIGGILYTIIIFNVFRTTFRAWQRTRRPTMLAVMALLVVIFGHWMYGGQYSTAALCFFCIGSIERFARNMQVATASPNIASRPARAKIQRAFSAMPGAVPCA